MNDWSNEPMIQWVHESMNDWSNEPMIQWDNEPMNEWVSETMNQWVRDSVYQWTNDSVNHWISDSMFQWINESWTNEWAAVAMRCEFNNLQPPAAIPHSRRIAASLALSCAQPYQCVLSQPVANPQDRHAKLTIIVCAASPVRTQPHKSGAAPNA